MSNEPLFPTNGLELPNVAAAKREAIERIRLLLNTEAGWATANLSREVHITDESGDLVAVVTFREAVGCAMREIHGSLDFLPDTDHRGNRVSSTIASFNIAEK